MSELVAKCPAAQMTRTVVSLNKQDVRCGIQGIVRGAKDAPCCADYWQCAIWKGEKDRIERGKKKNKADRHLGPSGWVDA